jgi:hypothetical protein
VAFGVNGAKILIFMRPFMDNGVSMIELNILRRRNIAQA